MGGDMDNDKNRRIVRIEVPVGRPVFPPASLQGGVNKQQVARDTQAFFTPKVPLKRMSGSTNVLATSCRL